jgi:DNA-binding YbaB/EbfC family protein
MAKRGFRGGFPGGGGGNMKGLMQQVQKMQRDMEAAQEETRLMTGEAQAGGGVVKVSVDADRMITSLEIDPSVVDPDDVEMLADLVTAAVNEAIRNLDEKVEKRMSAVTGGMDLGGFPGF